MRDGFAEGFVSVGGNRLFYRTRGAPGRGSLLLIHGGPGANHLGFLPLADLAQFGYRVVWYDQRGCGRSSRPRGAANYSIELLAEEAEGVRRALQLGRVHLFGHSFGGPVALSAALRFPERWKSLIVASGFSRGQDLADDENRKFAAAPLSVQRAIEKFERLGDLKHPSYLVARERYAQLVPQTSEGRPAAISRLQVRPWELGQMVATFNPRIGHYFGGEGDDRVLTPLDGSLKDWDVMAKLDKIRIPTLVTVGRYDTVDIRHSKEIHDRIRGSRLVVFERSGHATMFDERDRYVATLREFLDGVD